MVNGVHAKTGGGATYLSSVLPLLADDDELEVHLFLHRQQFSMFKGLDDRIRIHLFDFPPNTASLLAWEQLALPIIARGMAADIVFSPANFGPLLCGSSVVLLRNALAVGQREARLGKRLYWAVLALATGLSILRSRRVIAVSNYAATALTRHLPASARRKVSVVHHGVRPQFLAAPAAEARDAYLLVVGDIYIQKNLHTMLEAINQVRASEPEIRVKIVGRVVDRGYFLQLEDLIRRLGLQDCVAFLGHVGQDALIELYRRCRLLVFPSTVETFGHPLVEAMACGTAIASSNTTAMPEILDDAGLYFDPLDRDDMAARILQLYRDAALRKELGDRGRRRAEEFSLLKTAQETARVLKAAARPARMPAR